VERLLLRVMQCRDGQANQSRIVADAAKARYWTVSMASQDPALLRRLLRAKDRMAPPRKTIGQSRGSPASAGCPKRTLRGLSKKPSAFRRIAIC
jgi:hypothetical protein